MAKAVCGLTGITYRCDYLNFKLRAREVAHPVFSLPTIRLLELFKDWLDADKKMNREESYLLYVALLASTELVVFNEPAMLGKNTSRIVSSTMTRVARLAETVENMGQQRARELAGLPVVAISKQTADLHNALHWIELWEEALEDHTRKYKPKFVEDLLSKRQVLLEKAIKNRDISISKYVGHLARWASVWASFPDTVMTTVKDIHGDKEVTVSDHWQWVIKQCARPTIAWEVEENDLQELLDHIHENTEDADLVSFTLIKLIEEAIARRKDFFRFGCLDIGKPTFTINSVGEKVHNTAQVNCVSTAGLITDAPTSEPKLSDYTSRTAFIIATAKWRGVKAAMENTNVNI